MANCRHYFFMLVMMAFLFSMFINKSAGHDK